MKYKFIKKHKVLVGISSIILGSWMTFYDKNKWGLIFLSAGMLILFWRHKQ